MKADKYISAANTLTILLSITSIFGIHVTLDQFEANRRVEAARMVFAEWIFYDQIANEYEALSVLKEKNEAYKVPTSRSDFYNNVGHVELRSDGKSATVSVVSKVQDDDPNLFPRGFEIHPWSMRIPESCVSDVVNGQKATFVGAISGLAMMMAATQFAAHGKDKETRERWQSELQKDPRLKEIELSRYERLKRLEAMANFQDGKQAEDQEQLLAPKIFNDLEQTYYHRLVMVSILNVSLDPLWAELALAVIMWALITAVASLLRATFADPVLGEGEPWLLLDGSGLSGKCLAFLWLGWLTLAPLCLMSLFLFHFVSGVRLELVQLGLVGISVAGLLVVSLISSAVDAVIIMRSVLRLRRLRSSAVLNSTPVKQE